MPKLFDFQAESMPSWYDGNYMMPWTHETLKLIKGDGASQVVIVPTVYMDSLNSTVVYRDNTDPGGVVLGTARDENGNLINGAAPRTESDASIRTAIQRAKDLDLEVIFKLHVNMQNDDWNALIGPPKHADGSLPTEAEWMEFGDAWFASYKESVLHYARLAKEMGVTAFAIGNECESMTHPRFTAHWKEIIKAIREEVGYTGKLTYAATWTEALHVQFWDELDYIGANPYISFTQDNPNPTVQELIDGWTKPSEIWGVKTPIEARFGENISAMDALQRIAEQFGKKLIFTETGFRSLDGSNATPWMWGNGDIDELEQLNMHKAFYKIITDRAGEGWMGGYWLWNYDASEAVSDPSPDDGFSTHGKRADALVEQYFKDPLSIIGRSLEGTVGGDDLLGGFNHDTLIGGQGNDTLLGGAGGDVFMYYAGDGADTVTDFKFSEGDKIALMNTDATEFGDLDISSVAGGYVVSFADGGSITILTSEILSAEWFAFNGTGKPAPSTKPTDNDDEISGTDKANVIDAKAGHDTINGQGGNDKLTGGAGDDTIDAGTGNDAVYGGIGDDFAVGGDGADRLYGSNGFDILYGGAGNDQISGESDDDMLYGEAGNDIVRGGTGRDLLQGGDGDDKLYGEADNDQLVGGEGHDLMQGGDGKDVLRGENGNDKLYGGNGDDVLGGWFGDDQLWGGAGNDVLDPGAGNDKLWGGAGADRYVFNSDMGQDIVYDFKVKQNEMLLIRHDINHSGIVDFATLKPHMKQVGKNVVMDLGTGEWLKGDDQLTLVNIRLKDLKAEHFYFYW